MMPSWRVRLWYIQIGICVVCLGLSAIKIAPARALLVYHMTRQLLLGQEKVSLIYGAYTATAYFTPMFGGVIADRWLGVSGGVKTVEISRFENRVAA